MPLTTIYDGGTRIVGDTSALDESLHPAVMAYVNAMRSSTGGNYAMTVNEIDAVNNMVKALVSNGLWTKIKAIYPIIGGTAAAHKYNLKDARDADAAFRLTFSGTWTHSSNGMQPNGTTGFANTFFNPFSNLTINNTHLAIYSNLQINTDPNTPPNNTGLIAGVNTNTFVNRFDLGIKYTESVSVNNLSFTTSGSSVSLGTGFTETSTEGFYIGSRTSSTNNQYYKNGISRATNTQTSTAALPNANLYLGAWNNQPPPNQTFYGNRRIALASVGDGLTAIEAKAFSTIVQAFQTKLGRQVTI